MDKMQKMMNEADSVAIYATTPFYSDKNVNLKLHTEIVFFKNDTAISTL